MGLVDKLRESGKRAKDLALAGALGSSVYLSGCGPALMGLGAGTPGARGAALYAFGSGVTQLEAAEAGKSEIKQTVNVNNLQQNPHNNSPFESYFIKDGKLYGKNDVGPIDNEYFVDDQKKLYIKIGENYIFFGFAKYR